MPLAHQRGQDSVERIVSGHFVGAVGADDQQRNIGEMTTDDAEEVETGRVRPMQVLQHDQDGAHRSKDSQELSHLGEERPRPTHRDRLVVDKDGGEGGSPSAGR